MRPMRPKQPGGAGALGFENLGVADQADGGGVAGVLELAWMPLISGSSGR
jgi:hypothetical protein